MRLAIIGDGLLARTLVETLDTGNRQPHVSAMRFPHDALDVTDPKTLAFLGKHYDVAINTAAFHDLTKCEADPDRAFAVNATGAGNVARVLPTLYISSDFVFNDGGPHDECLPGQQPRSVYGRSKLAGEMETLAHDGIVVRVSALYGHHESRKNGSKGFPSAIVSSHDPIRLPTDQTFSPAYAPDAAERIIDLAVGMARFLAGESDTLHSGIYHAANRGFTTWAAFAEHVLGVTRHERHVLPFAAHDRLRPKNSALKSTRQPALPFWADGLSRWAMREEHVPFVVAKRDA